MADATVTRTVWLDAPCGEVWQNLVQPEELAAWMGGPMALDPRPGGVGRASLPEGERSILVTTVDEGRHLGWVWTGEDGQLSTVDLTIEPADEGTTLTVVERSVVSSPASASARTGAGRGGVARAALVGV
jgi:uncharacterized protein YndB with AHSA1/START domain